MKMITLQSWEKSQKRGNTASTDTMSAHSGISKAGRDIFS